MYTQNEDSHLDWKGDILDRQYHNKALQNESYDPLNIESVIAICCDVHMTGPYEFGKMESQLISNIVDEALHYNHQNEMPDWYRIPSDQDQVGIHLSSINTTLDPITFAHSLSN